MAPGPDGTLLVSIPRPGGSVLAPLDRSGSPRLGWPITVRDSTVCGLLLPLEDGSVRVVCTLENPEGNMYSPIRAFAFDRESRAMTGWPVDLAGPAVTGRTVGDVLTLSETFGSDVITEGQPSHTVRLATVAADGAFRSGAEVPMFPIWPWPGDRWSVGPDGIVYGVIADGGSGQPGVAEESQITALDLSGERAGWPIRIDGIASGPAFGSGGQIVVTVGSFVGRTSRVLAFDRDGQAISARSTELPIATGVLWEFGVDGPYDCGVPSPRPPLITQDGTIFVFSEIDEAIFALDASLEVMSGWPVNAGPLERPNPWLGHDGITCPSLALPAAGPDGTLYLALQARGSSVGGSLVAVGPDGRVRPGWPVELPRPGAEFWSVVVGSDGTIYALAIEPEPGEASSATILAIAPDSTVLYTTTIIEP